MIPIRNRRSPNRGTSLDFSQVREAMRGAPTNYISYATVGHADVTPMYARIENNQVYVEVTLVPSGDEIVARLETGGGADGAGFYMPLAYGSRVVVGLPGGTGTEAVIISRCNDASWPFPETVSGITTHVPVPSPASAPAPLWAFLRTADGYLLGIETGDGGDIVIHSGASVEIKVNGGEQILLNGPTHIGATYTTPPIGGAVAPGGEITPGTEGVAFVPVPFVLTPVEGPTPIIPTPGIPEDGILRIKDSLQTGADVDPIFWTFLTAVAAFCGGLTLPPALNVQAKSSSNNTCADGPAIV